MNSTRGRSHALMFWTLVVLIFLYLPIVLLLVYSFNASRLNIRWEGFTLDWYRALFAIARSSVRWKTA